MYPSKLTLTVTIIIMLIQASMQLAKYSYSMFIRIRNVLKYTKYDAFASILLGYYKFDDCSIRVYLVVNIHLCTLIYFIR